MADTTPIVVQQGPGYGAQVVIGALAGVLAWWLIETIASSRRAWEDEAIDEAQRDL